MTEAELSSQASPERLAHTGNHILEGLPSAELEQIQNELTVVSLELKEPLWLPNQRIELVYFPIDAVVSVLAETEGGMVEVGTIGNEGVVGLPVFLGAQSFAGTALVQIPGRAHRMDAQAFRRAAQDGQLRSLVQRYTLGFLTQVSQGTACNRTHSAEQRLARWLLIVRDRVGRDSFPLTQEFMGQMLGVRRATVSETAATLHEKGLITYSRGAINIEDLPGLTRTACECYQIVRNEFERLLGTPMG
jgi:CRP-like cAMP-binding protein